MTGIKHTGGCFCGEIRFEFEAGDIPVANCHCSMCRRTSGAPYVTWLVVPEGQFSFLNGEPAVLRSSDEGTRYFCKQCGTPLTCVNASHPEIVDVTLGSLDQPEAFTPTFDVYCDTALPFVTLENPR